MKLLFIQPYINKTRRWCNRDSSIVAVGQRGRAWRVRAVHARKLSRLTHNTKAPGGRRDRGNRGHGEVEGTIVEKP